MGQVDKGIGGVDADADDIGDWDGGCVHEITLNEWRRFARAGEGETGVSDNYFGGVLKQDDTNIIWKGDSSREIVAEILNCTRFCREGVCVAARGVVITDDCCRHGTIAEMRCLSARRQPYAAERI